jgi:hypothetical protein
MMILIDGQLLPLTAQIKQPQDVVEDRMRAQLARRAATALCSDAARQIARTLRRSISLESLATTGFGPLRPSKHRDSSRFERGGRNPRPWRFQSFPPARKNPQPVDRKIKLVENLARFC